MNNRTGTCNASDSRNPSESHATMTVPSSARSEERSKAESAYDAYTNHSPSSDPNLTVRQVTTRVPSQMPQPIEAMKRKRQRQSHLRKHLEEHRPLCETRRHCRARQIPAQHRRRQVREAKDVQGAREGHARQAVQAG